MKHRQRPAETLEADAIAEARKIGSELMPGFVPTAGIQFLEKDEFIELLTKTHSGNEGEAYRLFVKYGAVGLFDDASDRAFVTFTERAPSYRAALVNTVHEREGHAYMRCMNALKELSQLCELAGKVQQQNEVAVSPIARGALHLLEPGKPQTSDEVSERDLVNATLAREVIQFFDEGFTYWLTVKAVERVKSDKKRFRQYGQTRVDAWAPLNRDPCSIGEERESERYINGRYRHNSWNGLAFYSEIEKMFGESAVPLAAKACLDVPLKELVDEDMAYLYAVILMSDDYGLAGNIANKETSKYAARKLAELSAVLKPVENDRYKRSLLAEVIEKGEDSFFGPKGRPLVNYSSGS